MRRVAAHGPVFYQFEQWPGNDGLVHGVFTRLGGVSVPPWASLNVGRTVGDDPAAVERNKALMYEALGVDGRRACTVWQVHGADTVIITEPPAESLPWLARADGMVTDCRGVPLVMRFADCAPILLYDPVRKVIGMAHAGWRGTVVGAAPSAVRAMVQAFGCRSHDIQAGIGPSIGPERYRVGEEVVGAFCEVFGDLNGLVRRAEDGSALLNLWEANRRALHAVGVTQIEVAGICTATRTDEFYSHRAERGRTGRFGVVMALRA